MRKVTMVELCGRVLTSRERVKFAHADPYGHLSSGAYVNMIMSHRVEVLEDVIGFSVLNFTRLGVAFPARSIEVAYLRPAFVSWLSTVKDLP